MNALFERDFDGVVDVCFEHSVNVGGMSYLLIFGRHVNGGFICIPNHNIGCEATTVPYTVEYNTDKMVEAGLDREVARALALHIEDWINRNLKNG